MISGPDDPSEDRNETARLEAFSDGVFAIAITLLVLDLRPPVPSAHGPRLAYLLLREWPSYVAFALSFAFIGIMWINHHRLFRLIQRSDHGLLVLNGLLLFGVTVVPFPTKILADFIASRDARVAAMIYSGTYVLIALLFNGLWRYASHKNRLLDPGSDPKSAALIDRAYAIGIVLYLIDFALAMVSVPACLAMNGALAVFFALPEHHQARFTPSQGSNPRQ